MEKRCQNIIETARMMQRLKMMEDENSEKVVQFCGRQKKRQMQRDSYCGIQSISEK